MDEQTQYALNQYVTDLFAQEDDVLKHIQAETQRNDMPQINLSPQEGRLLQFLAQSVATRKAVEIGTLAGYSGTWLARALPDDGKLYTLEASSKHAQVARASFERAGLADKVELLEGAALTMLGKIEQHGPFDFVFIDADKGTYPQYLGWAVDNLRVGGMVAAHNAFANGRVTAEGDDFARDMHTFNQLMAREPRLSSTIIAVGDGMAAGIKMA
jgi:caffeoyl-CoA O-methyltransferase